MKTCTGIIRKYHVKRRWLEKNNGYGSNKFIKLKFSMFFFPEVSNHLCWGWNFPEKWWNCIAFTHWPWTEIMIHTDVIQLFVKNIIPTDISHITHVKITLLLKLCWLLGWCLWLVWIPIHWISGSNTPPTPHPPSLKLSKAQVTQHHGGEERRTFTFSLGVFLRVRSMGINHKFFTTKPNPLATHRSEGEDGQEKTCDVWEFCWKTWDSC